MKRLRFLPILLVVFLISCGVIATPTQSSYDQGEIGIKSTPESMDASITVTPFLPATVTTAPKEVDGFPANIEPTFMLLRIDGEIALVNPGEPEIIYKILERTDNRIIEPFPYQLSPNGYFVTLGGLRPEVGKSRLYILDIRDNSIRQLMSRSESQLVPRWNPEGNMIAFELDSDNGSDIYVIKPDGSGLRKLYSANQWNRLPIWSPEGDLIFYLSSSVKDVFPPANIHVLNSEGNFHLQLTLDPFEISNMSISPDGEMILFSGPTMSEDVYVISVDGGMIYNLTDNPSRDTNPIWSPDGSKIVFQSDRGGDWDIYDMDRDGSNVKQLTNNPGVDVPHCWSPNGDYLAFTSDRNGSRQIYILVMKDLSIKKITNASRDVYLADIWAGEDISLPNYIGLFRIGRILSVSDDGSDLNVRTEPGLDGDILTQLIPGDTVTLIEGPKLIDGYTWWKVQVDSNGQEGWVATNPDWFLPIQ